MASEPEVPTGVPGGVGWLIFAFASTYEGSLGKAGTGAGALGVPGAAGASPAPGLTPAGSGAGRAIDAEGVPLMEGWMFGRLLFPLAMHEVQRVPPANDDAD